MTRGQCIMKFEAVLFDMDGTLLDSAPDFIAIAQQLLKEYEFAPVDDNKIREVVSGGAKVMISAAFDIKETHPLFEPLRLEFLANYLQNCAVYSKLYEGIDQLLVNIEKSGLRWGIVTNKPIRFAEPIMQRLGLRKRCAVLVCPEHVTHCKPSPEPILLATKQLAIDPSTVIYVGDDKRDIESGNEAGCKTIAVEYGYIHPSDNPRSWGAGAVVQSVAELYQLIDSALCGC